jgi:hypothetical protein
MTKRITILISGLMIVLPMLTIFLLEDNQAKHGESILDFFAGIVFGAGIVIFAKAISKKPGTK